MEINQIMALNTAISKRRSFRSFIQTPLSEDIMDGLVDFISALEPPAEDIDWNFDTLPYIDMVRICSREPGVKAPHYLVLRAERKLFSLQMSAYIGEMAVLYLTDLGIGTCWLGNLSVDPNQDFPDSLPFVAAIAFGHSDESFREDAYFDDRLPANKTCYGQYAKYREIMDAARYAPTWMNKQPCAFIADERNTIHIYRKKPFMKNPVLSYTQCLDAGAAMAHLEITAQAAGYHRARLFRLSREPMFKKMIYQASLELKL